MAVTIISLAQVRSQVTNNSEWDHSTIEVYEPLPRPARAGRRLIASLMYVEPVTSEPQVIPIPTSPFLADPSV